MTRSTRILPHLLCTVAIGLLLTWPALAEMPEGHPQLPEGHPQVPAGQPNLPDGHPQLPAGHPPVPGGAAPSNAPFSGSIAIKATQGTKDAAIPAGDAVRVDFHMNDKVISTQNGKLDEHGVLILDNIKLLGAVQPLVTVTHAGVPYRGLGSVMSADHPDMMVRVPVYETTTEAPDWQVVMRHVMIDRIDKGLLVNEVLAIRTPGDRTWTGDPDTHTTLVIDLPAHRGETYLGPGLQDEAVKIEGNRIVDHLPLSPGDMQVQIAYILPVKSGETSLQITAPAAVKQLVVFAADDGSTVTPTGLTAGQSMKMGPQAVRMFTATNLTAKQQVSLAFKGIPDVPAAPAGPDGKARSDAAMPGDSGGEPTAPASPTSDDSAKVIAGVGAVVAGVAVAVVLLTKKSNAAKDNTNA